MGNKYVRNDLPYWVDGTELRIREVLTDYNNNIQKFETEHSKRAGIRARKNLLELFHLCRARRKEISLQSKEYGYFLHPSWEGVDEDE